MTKITTHFTSQHSKSFFRYYFNIFFSQDFAQKIPVSLAFESITKSNAFSTHSQTLISVKIEKKKRNIAKIFRKELFFLSDFFNTNSIIQLSLQFGKRFAKNYNLNDLNIKIIVTSKRQAINLFSDYLLIQSIFIEKFFFVRLID